MSNEILERFAQNSPIAVMTHSLLENLLSANKIDHWFDSIHTSQYTRTILFSSILELMLKVVCKIRPSVHSAYRDSNITTSIIAVYDKLKNIETTTSKSLVRQIAVDAEALIKNTNETNPPLQPGYTIKWLDGNSIESTYHRLKVLRDTKAGTLPGKSLVVFDQELGIVTDVFPCENGHTQERLILHEVLDTIKINGLWIADRNFCVLKFLFEIDNKSAFFTIRQHGNFPFKQLTKLKFIGKSETGNVFE